MLDTGQLPLSGEALLWFRQGLAAAAAEEYEQAVAFYNRVLDVRSDYYEAWYERGLALENWGYYTDAIASFDRALSLCPRHTAASEVWHDRGNALQYGLGKYLEAMACYDRALELKPDHEQAWQNRGNALLYGLSRAEDAIRCYERAISINPENYLTWRNLGNALVELRRHADAISSYDRALSLNPDDEVSWHARNLASERSGLIVGQPTTKPAWYSVGEATLVEGEERAMAYASARAVSAEAAAHQPLLVIEDDWGRREIPLERDQYTIGRDSSNDIQLYSKFVSRQHAVLSKVTTADSRLQYQITDGYGGKPSTNGLLINSQKCRSHLLQSDDVIICGPGVQMVYHLSQTPPIGGF